MHDSAAVIIEYSVITVLAFLSKTMIATFPQTMEIGAAEIPASRALANIAGNCRHIANLRIRGLTDRIGKSRKARLDPGVRRNLGKRRQRPNAQPLWIKRYMIRIRDIENIYKAVRRYNLALHLVQQIDATCFQSGSVAVD